MTAVDVLLGHGVVLHGFLEQTGHDQEGVVRDAQTGVDALKVVVAIGGRPAHHGADELRLVVDLAAHVDVGEVGRHDLVIEAVLVERRDDLAHRGEAAVSLEDGLAQGILSMGLRTAQAYTLGGRLARAAQGSSGLCHSEAERSIW